MSAKRKQQSTSAPAIMNGWDPRSGTKPRREDLETIDGSTYLTSLYRDENLTDEQVAQRLGVSRQTLHNWRKQSQIIQDAMRMGKATIDTQVENMLLKKALSGDTVAMLFWLKNRKPKQWKDNRGPRDDVDHGAVKEQQEQTKAIADMINDPAPQRVLTDYLGPNSLTNENDGGSDEGAGK